MTMQLKSVEELVDFVKTLPKKDAQKQVRWFLLAFIGEDKKRDPLRNRFRRELRRKAGEL